jgi:5-methylcytosine-specific restriction endonuclease McrA
MARKAISKKMRLEVYNKYNGHCAYCGKELEYKDMQVDHLIPVQR